jgi:RNA methyltransferase, TrmH family
MLSSAQIKEIRSLHLRKNREEGRLFIVEGVKMVGELLKSDFIIQSIYGTEKWVQDVKLKKGTKSPAIQTISPGELGRISTLKTPNEVLAVVRMRERVLNISDFDGLALMIDHIADPGNLGTIIRIADWFGIKTIVGSPDTVELYNPKVVQATMGSLFRVKVFYNELPEVLEKFTQNIPKYGAVLDGENIYKENLPEKAVIIIGNESHGISDEVKSLIDRPVMIPAVASGAESLNASVATAIICSEFRRKALIKI